jgi:hypothetical protein
MDRWNRQFRGGRRSCQSFLLRALHGSQVWWRTGTIAPSSPPRLRSIWNCFSKPLHPVVSSLLGRIALASGILCFVRNSGNADLGQVESQIRYSGVATAITYDLAAMPSMRKTSNRPARTAVVSELRPKIPNRD